jgi:asparagine synthase (glutamine-hydrolysing)
VSLSGDGGDELFAGYPRYRAVSWGACLDRVRPLRTVLAARVWQKLPASPRQKSLVRQFKRFSQSLGQSPQRRYLEWIAIFNEARRAELYTDGFLTLLPDSDPFEFLQAAWRRAGGRDPVTAVSLADLTTYLPCDLMTKVDIASMAHSLECRQPFLDYRLVELAVRLPLRLKYRWGCGKRLLRAAFGPLLPREIWRRRKMGFGVPLDHWFRDELREMTHDALLAPGALSGSYFRRDVVAAYVEQHERAQFDHSYRLWALLVFELWLRRWARAETG